MQRLSSFFYPFIISTLLIFGCSTSGTTINNDKETETNTSQNSETDENSASASVLTATNEWYFDDADEEEYRGTGLSDLYKSIESETLPDNKVIVAIIDSGTDIFHEDLNANIWVNEDEIANNGLDDDQNGYIDDVYGWNFIGGADSTHVEHDTYEVTRLYVKLSDQYENLNPDSLSDADQEGYERYLEIKDAYENRVEQNRKDLQEFTNIAGTIRMAKQMLNVSSIDSLSESDLSPSSTDSQMKRQSKQIITMIKQNGATEADLEELEAYVEQLKDLQEYGLNPDFDPRYIVGDDYDDLSDRSYGNNDVTGPDNSHGTHVAGIVGAVRANNIGTRGITDSVQLMPIRTVPNGDERDKDVANAIRYAVENGAMVINMSFGKGYSPQKAYVDEAVRLAEEKGVLLVSGAGNGSDNIDSTDSFPTPYYLDGTKAKNFITVGASSWQPDSNLVATFSNYGKNNVDIFAPGVSIYSTYPDNTYKMEDGTSMAAPVVSGAAALLKAHFPSLSMLQIKDIILETATKIDQTVYKPGTTDPIPFSELSVTGGIININQAFLRAKELSQN